MSGRSHLPRRSVCGEKGLIVVSKKEPLILPPRVLSDVRSDIRSYLRGGYSFADFLDRNNYGRRYGDTLLEIWKEEEGKQNAD